MNDPVNDPVNDAVNDPSPGPGLDAREAVGRLLRPRAVALVGASNDLAKFSGQPLRNLLAAHYPGAVHPVNPRGGDIGGVPALSSVRELPDGVDVAMVMVPAAGCAQTVRELGAAGVPVAVIAVSGFAEMGTDEGVRLQEELAAAGRESGVRVVGPNCNGVYQTEVPLPLGYNHTHSLALQPGSVALVAHSGALFGGFVPMLESFGQGISSFVSCGNEVDLELTDYVDYLIEDDQTRVLALILDGVTDGHRFRSALRRAREAGKQVVALKLGNTSAGNSAAQAHSSRMAGTAAVYEAVLASEGAVLVPTLETLAIVSALAAGGRSARTPYTTALSTSGAGGILLADNLGRYGVALTELADVTHATMAPRAGFARVMNPFDIGAAGPNTIHDHLAALAGDPGTGALLFYLTPTPTEAWRVSLAEALAVTATAHADLPVVVASPAPLGEREARIYADAGVPVVASLLDATVAVRSMVDARFPGSGSTDAAPASLGRTGADGHALSEPASKAYLAGRGVAMTRELLVDSLDAARKAGTDLGYPLVLKAAGAGLTHKTEHALVVLGVTDEGALESVYLDLDRRGRSLDPDGYEGVIVSPMAEPGVDVVVGMTRDAEFGPMILVGAGGVLTEFLADVALAPTPVDAGRAGALVASTAVSRLLSGYRSTPPADLQALVGLVEQVSRIAEEDPALEAIDLNPVRVLPAGLGLVVLDALVVRLP